MSFQHEEEVELPERCQEFFEAFSREKNGAGSFSGEASDVAAEAEGAEGGGTAIVGSRSGVPRWTHRQVKAMCGGELNVEKVAKALTRIFGGDSTLNAKDATFRQTVTICTSWTMTLTSPGLLKSSTMVMTGNGMMRNGMMKLSSTPLKRGSRGAGPSISRCRRCQCELPGQPTEDERTCAGKRLLPCCRARSAWATARVVAKAVARVLTKD